MSDSEPVGYLPPTWPYDEPAAGADRCARCGAFVDHEMQLQHATEHADADGVAAQLKELRAELRSLDERLAPKAMPVGDEFIERYDTPVLRGEKTPTVLTKRCPILSPMTLDMMGYNDVVRRLFPAFEAEGGEVVETGRDTFRAWRDGRLVADYCDDGTGSGVLRPRPVEVTDD